MESAVGLRFSGILNQHSICMLSGLQAARATKVPHLGFIHSSVSVPKSSRTGPIEHIKGFASTSPFFRRIGSGRMMNCRVNASVRMPSSGAANIDHHLEVMEVAKKLKESCKYTLAEEILKLHKSKVKDDPEAAYQVNMEIMHILSLQEKTPEAILAYAEELYQNKEIYAKRFQFELFYATKLMEIAMKLKESHQYDLAVKLLKVHDPEVENDPEASYYVKMELMHILFLQEKYDEAKIYCEELDKKEPIYGAHFKSGVFYALKSGILCGLNQHEEAIEFMHKFNQNRCEATPLVPPDHKHASIEILGA